MPTENHGAGRLVPASALDFSRYSKNLAWLLQCPLHAAQGFLAYSYGFGSVHELKACIPSADATDILTGPFDIPRERPAYFVPDEIPHTAEPDMLSRITVRERRLIRLLERQPYDDNAHQGHKRRRLYAVIDAAFFAAPSVHRKRFAEVKRGILAMEGLDTEREAYLEQNWPPAFWAFLECTQLLYADGRECLTELQNSSIYFRADEVQAIGNIFQNTAAHRAPAVFLAMAGEDPGVVECAMPEYVLYDDELGLPLVGNSKPGLFFLEDYDYWANALRENLQDEFTPELHEQLYAMSPHVLAATPPPGTPARVVSLARKWRLHQLRALSEHYINSPYTARYFSATSGLYWPGSFPQGGPSELPVEAQVAANHALLCAGTVPYLTLHTELEGESASTVESEHRQLWKFKTLITRWTRNEPEEAVGYMAGWVFAPASEKYVCNTETVLEEAKWDHGPMLHQGLSAFINTYLPFAGHDDLLAFANSRWHSSVAVSEIVLRKEYRKQGLMSVALSAFNQMFTDVPFSTEPPLPIYANFDLEDEPDAMEMAAELEMAPPGVFMIPMPPNAKRLQRYLMGMSPDHHDLDDDSDVDVFPFRVQRAQEPGAE